MSSQKAWSTVFQRLLHVPNLRYAFLWLSGGLVFALWIKPSVKRRDRDLMIEDIDNYLENKRKNDST